MSHVVEVGGRWLTSQRAATAAGVLFWLAAVRSRFLSEVSTGLHPGSGEGSAEHEGLATRGLLPRNRP